MLILCVCLLGPQKCDVAKLHYALIAYTWSDEEQDDMDSDAMDSDAMDADDIDEDERPYEKDVETGKPLWGPVELPEFSGLRRAGTFNLEPEVGWKQRMDCSYYGIFDIGQAHHIYEELVVQFTGVLLIMRVPRHEIA